MDALEQELKQYVKGEVRFDRFSRVLYSTDASIYEIEPIGVVIPKGEEDVAAVVRIARENGVPILPRGGGTSLAGQAVGRAVVVDMSKFMNRILEVNPEGQWVRVQPGIVLDELNAHLRPSGLFFAPDVAPSNRATIGGMVGNNSCGARSIIYGKTVDHVEELRVLLAGGEEVVLKPLTKEAFQAKAKLKTLEGQIYREVQRIVEANRDEILTRYPKIMRRVGGYNLDEFVKDGELNLAKLVVGSEGTLATVLEVKLNLVPRPKMAALTIVHFREFLEAMEATNEILPFGPSAVELIDKMIIDLTRETLEYARRMTFVQGDPEALLLVEFYGTSLGELRAKVEGMEERLRRKGFGYAFVKVFDQEEQVNVWKVRKAGLGLLQGVRGDRKPIAFVEDTAVSPEHLPQYIRRFREILKEHGTTAGYYGHTSVGCIHIRPMINLKEVREIEKMRSIAEAIRDLVLEYGGAMSAEHGDGLARSQWNEKLFGPALYQAFKEVKRAFDPQGIMNPGKIVDAPPMTENLRYGPSYRTLPLKTYLSFEREGGFARAVELCNGMGVCRKKLEGTMCPSYMVTLEEEHSTRGRANLLRAVLSGKLPPEELSGKRLFEALDLCLECKGCKGECPSNVDMAKLKYEFLAHYYEANPRPLRSKLFGSVELLNKLGSRFAPFSNWVMGTRLARLALHRLVGIAPERTLPPFARPTFPEWFAERRVKPTGRRGKVVLFPDTFMTYNYPEIGKAAVRVLEAAGFEVILPEKTCCGRPMISKGMLKEVKANARYNVEKLSAYANQGIPIVGCEPSCLLTFRDEYPDLIDDERATLVAKDSFLLEEFLLRLHEKGELDLRFNGSKRKLLFHGHCHQKALVGSAPSLKVLRLPGFEVEEVDSGCCGMAGSFGYEAEHYEISMAVGERRLFKAIRERGSEVEIVANGVSCRQQIVHGTGRRAKHIAEVLADALK